MRKYYYADVYVKKDNRFQSVGNYIVTPTIDGAFREVLTGKRIGAFSDVGEPHMAYGNSTEKYKKKKGRDFSTLYVDRGSLQVIQKENLGNDLTEYSKNDKEELEMYFLRTVVLSGEIPKKYNFYHATIVSFIPGFRHSYWGHIDKYASKKGSYIVIDTKKTYREILTGEEFGYFRTVSGECPMDGMPFIGYGFRTTEKHKTMLVNHDGIKQIKPEYLKKCVEGYIEKYDIDTLKDVFNKREESFENKKKILTPGTSVELD